MARPPDDQAQQSRLSDATARRVKLATRDCHEHIENELYRALQCIFDRYAHVREDALNRLIEVETPHYAAHEQPGVVAQIRAQFPTHIKNFEYQHSGGMCQASFRFEHDAEERPMFTLPPLLRERPRPEAPPPTIEYHPPNQSAQRDVSGDFPQRPFTFHPPPPIPTPVSLSVSAEPEVTSSASRKEAVRHQLPSAPSPGDVSRDARRLRRESQRPQSPAKPPTRLKITRSRPGESDVGEPERHAKARRVLPAAQTRANRNPGAGARRDLLRVEGTGSQKTYLYSNSKLFVNRTITYNLAQDAFKDSYLFPYRLGDDPQFYMLVCPEPTCKGPSTFSQHPLVQNRAVDHFSACSVPFRDVDDLIERYARPVIHRTGKLPITEEMAMAHNREIEGVDLNEEPSQDLTTIRRRTIGEEGLLGESTSHGAQDPAGDLNHDGDAENTDIQGEESVTGPVWDAV